MASFNTTTGAVTVGTTTITPLADGSNLDTNYSNLFSSGIQTNSPNFPKNINSMNVPGPFVGPSTLTSVVTDPSKLPSAILITIASPPVKILGYVNSNGTSSYIIKNDPSNLSTLIPGGIQVVASAPLTSTGTSTAATGIPPSAIIICILCILTLLGLFMYLRK